MSITPHADVVILHQHVDDTADASERDVLVQAAAVGAGLSRLGYRARTLACTLDLDGLQRELLRQRPSCVFNLVESLDGSDRLMPLVPILLDRLHIPYTGSSAVSIAQSSGKLTAKRILRQAGLPTPNWSDGDEVDPALLRRPVIVKAIHEHASFGLNDEAVRTFQTARELVRYLNQREAETGQPHFAEQFIPGREFNISLLAGPRGPLVLPPAEIDFSHLPAQRLRIVGFAAKWDEDSEEYVGTPRRFDLPASDGPLVTELQRLCRGCWDLFELNGYARVDFRVDEQGRPSILEINVNPCLSPDAGFTAAVAAAGLTYDAALERILNDTVMDGSRHAARRSLRHVGRTC